jgi:hypothetical protein
MKRPEQRAMTDFYIHHRVMTEPREWQAVAEELAGTSIQRIEAQGGMLFGVWRSQIGRPRDELTVITVWSDADTAASAPEMLLNGVPSIRAHASTAMLPTLRPESREPPRRQGNYAFRTFDLPGENWQEFLDLCIAAWPGFESAYDSQIIGLWRYLEAEDAPTRSLLLTRRPNLAMWERSKIPDGPEETEVRQKLSRRYDLCDATAVHTTTLLTADDREDTVRWT